MKDLNTILALNKTTKEKYEISRKGFTMAEFEEQQKQLRELRLIRWRKMHHDWKKAKKAADTTFKAAHNEVEMLFPLESFYPTEEDNAIGCLSQICYTPR